MPPTVLIVEDEVMIADLLLEAFEDEGVPAAVALSAGQATEVSNASSDLRVLVTDVNLGGELNGFELSRRIRDRHPRVAVFYLTGDSEQEATVRGVPGSVVIPKPYVPSDVAGRIARALLDRTQG